MATQIGPVPRRLRCWRGWSRVRLMSLPLPAVVLLLLGLIAVAPLALASPPDPLWIGGGFDAADGDDAVVAAPSADGAPDGAPLRAIKAPWPVLRAGPPSRSLGQAMSEFKKGVATGAQDEPAPSAAEPAKPEAAPDGVKADGGQSH